VLCREEYGYLPQPPTALTFSVEQGIVHNFCAGKARLDRVTVHCEIGERSFSFPFYATIPSGEEKYPFFVMINFRHDVPDRYMPTEELVDNGFAVLSFSYLDVTSDDGDFTNGLAGVLYPDGTRPADGAGKIAMWAWAAHRVMDYAMTLPMLDHTRGVVCGHSRLGKTALLTAATDLRFAIACSNDSGCSGAAISRGKEGERVCDICKRFPYWFCENYLAHVDREDEMPFDQHWLIGAIAPRPVLVGSASLDAWADPRSEQLSALAASDAYTRTGAKGFVGNGRFAEVGEAFFEGDIGYHLRAGRHYFAREDWHRLIEFVRLKTK
jgi:hypothetical protein